MEITDSGVQYLATKIGQGAALDWVQGDQSEPLRDIVDRRIKEAETDALTETWGPSEYYAWRELVWAYTVQAAFNTDAQGFGFALWKINEPD